MSDSPIVHELSQSIQTGASSLKTKNEWEPFHGPRGGEGWQHPVTGEVRYQDERPAAVDADDADERAGNVVDDDGGSITVDGEDYVVSPVEDFDSITTGDVVFIDFPTGYSAAIEVTDVHDDYVDGVIDRGNFEQNATVRRQDLHEHGIVRSVMGVQPDDDAGSIVDEPGVWVAPETSDPVKASDEIAEWNRDEIDSETVREEFFAGQRITVVGPNGVKEEVVDHVDYTRPGLALESDGPQSTTAIDILVDHEGYTIESYQDRDALSDTDLRRSAHRQWENGIRTTDIPYQTETKVREQVHDEVLPSIEDAEIASRVASNQYLLRDRVDRAACSGTEQYVVRVGEDTSLPTTQHEYGHGVLSAFGYQYERFDHEDSAGMSEARWRRRPTNLSNDFYDLAEENKVMGHYTEFDFGPDTRFFDPESYMFRDGTGDATGPPRFDRWRSRVEEEIENDGERLQFPRLEDREYEDVSDRSAREVFDSLERGDSLMLDVRQRQRDPDTGKLIDEYETERERLVFTGDRGDADVDDTDEGYMAKFTKPNGGSWRWGVEDDGSLRTHHGSEIVGVARGEYETPPITEDPALDPEAETAEEKIANLAAAANRAWYKQALVSDTEWSDFKKLDSVIGSSYSATNAHETIAQTHEVMQIPEEHFEARAVVKEHPTLAWAYCEVFDPSDKVKDRFGEELRDLGCDV